MSSVNDTQLLAIARLVAEIPSTAYEIGVETGRGTKNASAYLTWLKDQGYVRVTGEVPYGKRTSHLYEMTEAGRSWLRFKQRDKFQSLPGNLGVPG